mgnify:CR=1 FL=1
MSVNAPQEIDSYRGFRCYAQGLSYNCPRLALYGYETERKLRNAVDRKLRNNLTPREV